jgi:hypothetical protein
MNMRYLVRYVPDISMWGPTGSSRGSPMDQSGKVQLAGVGDSDEQVGEGAPDGQSGRVDCCPSLPPSVLGISCPRITELG